MWPFLGILACVGDASSHISYTGEFAFLTLHHTMDPNADVSRPDYIHGHMLGEPHRTVVCSHLRICAPIKTGCQETAHDKGDCVDCEYGIPHLREMQANPFLSKGTHGESARPGGKITESTGQTRGPPARSLSKPKCRKTETEGWPQNEAKAKLSWGEQQ